MKSRSKQPSHSYLWAFNSSVITSRNGVIFGLFQQMITDVRTTFHNWNFTFLKSSLLSSFVCGCCPGSESWILCIFALLALEEEKKKHNLKQFCVSLHMLASAYFFWLGCEQWVQSLALWRALYVFPVSWLLYKNFILQIWYRGALQRN